MDRERVSLVVKTARGSPTAVLKIGEKSFTFNGIITVECGVCGQRHEIDLIRGYPCLSQDISP